MLIHLYRISNNLIAVERNQCFDKITNIRLLWREEKEEIHEKLQRPS